MPYKTKETAVLDASVGADAGQLSQTHTTNIADTLPDFNNNFEDPEEFMKRLQRLQDPTILNTVTYNQLMDEVLPYRRTLIEGLLGTGAYILAGAPKIGKSFLVAQIAYQVSTGRDLWDCKVHGGTVLYLALEDDKKRLQERMARMFGVGETDRLHFATEAGMIGKDLDKQLENFMREHPDTVLIIVDTLQKIREAAGDTYSYSSDYEVIGRLKQFADSYNICVLIVHHTRKQPAGDTFDMISGTNGLMGAADGAILMKKEKRTDSTATLDFSSRDNPDQKLYLEKNQDSLIWELDHAEAELWKAPVDPILSKVAELITLENPYWEGSPTELVDYLQSDLIPNHLTKHLNVQAGRLMSEHHIAYLNCKKHKGRVVSFTLVPEDTI